MIKIRYITNAKSKTINNKDKKYSFTNIDNHKYYFNF